MNAIKAIYEMISIPCAAVRARVKSLGDPAIRRGREFEYGEEGQRRIIVYEPKGEAGDKVLIWFSRGVMKGEDPGSLRQIASVFVKEGYLFVACGVRGIAGFGYEEAVEEGFTAYNVACRVIGDMGYDTGKIVLGGSSFGGTIALLLAYGIDLGERYDVQIDNIAGVVSLSGFFEPDDIPGVKRIKKPGGPGSKPIKNPEDSGLKPIKKPGKKPGGLGSKLGKKPGDPGLKPIKNPEDSGNETYVDEDYGPEFSPMAVVEGLEDIPALLVHGKQDQISPYKKAVRFAGKLRDMNAGRHRREKWAELHVGGQEIVTLYGLTPWKYQHFAVSEGIFLENRKKSRALRFILRWVEQLGTRASGEKEIKTPIQDAVNAEKRAKKVAEQAAAGHDKI